MDYTDTRLREMFRINVLGMTTVTLGIRGVCDDAFCRITHEELQGYVVDQDVIQWDNTQLAKVGCQFQGVHLLHDTDADTA